MLATTPHWNYNKCYLCRVDLIVISFLHSNSGFSKPQNHCKVMCQINFTYSGRGKLMSQLYNYIRGLTVSNCPWTSSGGIFNVYSSYLSLYNINKLLISLREVKHMLYFIFEWQACSCRLHARMTFTSAVLYISR